MIYGPQKPIHEGGRNWKEESGASVLQRGFTGFYDKNGRHKLLVHSPKSTSQAFMVHPFFSKNIRGKILAERLLAGGHLRICYNMEWATFLK
ncbi:hypothetical protein [Flavisolibacter nicotianae]|uniref:hypothetical protein n=1 Tax=Flavisolibacter nicotianae TaxID=2364882 RepID=UPI000EAF4D79|nr:hypothetical protein [Flavisolibacter nicotianae]